MDLDPGNKLPEDASEALCAELCEPGDVGQARIERSSRAAHRVDLTDLSRCS